MSRSIALNVNPETNQPSLIIVTGAPGLRKEGLAKEIARELNHLVFCRDEFKRDFIQTLKHSHANLRREMDKEIDDAYFQAIELMLLKRSDLLIEASYDHQSWENRIGKLQRMAKVRIIDCSNDGLRARSRSAKRFLQLTRRNKKKLRHEFVPVNEARELAGSGGDYVRPNLPVPTMRLGFLSEYEAHLEGILSFITYSVSTHLPHKTAG